jgi:hypothetical protein
VLGGVGLHLGEHGVARGEEALDVRVEARVDEIDHAGIIQSVVGGQWSVVRGG